jgi:two-component system, NtrC family, sensor kinase
MKKAFLSGLLIAVTTVVSAQSRQVFYLNKLSKQDTLVTGWKFQAGDNPQCAKPSFDDSKWQSTDTREDIQQFSELRKSGIAWIRLHIDVDSAVAKQQLAAYIVQYAASEVYLNGKLIHKYGIVSPDPDKVSAYLPSAMPFNIELKPHTDNVFAIRLAYQPGIPYLSIYYAPLPVFTIYINDQQTALANYDRNQQRTTMYVIIFALASGVLLIISIIYLVYFLYDRSQKVNLYYAAFTFALCINSLPIEVWGVRRFGFISSQMWVFFIEGVGVTAGMLMLLMTIYTLFGYMRRTIFKILILIGLAVTISMYTSGYLGFLVASIGFPIICLIEGLHVCIWAIRHRKKDAAIILTGVIFFTLFTVSYYFINADTVLAQLTFYIAQMSFPIGMSFYLSLQSSLTSKKLRTTLQDVQILSAKNLAQEQEKQQILADQNVLLETQVNERTAELNQSLINLKSTQTQLIQSEKMASLGELTAGIAHEIQNPLNFVNNFSEVSAELTQELKEELKAGNTADAIAIANDLEQNLGKIQHHGKRADAIVKGMLQHSQAGSGTKEPTNINALADEFLRLAYHGLRAKDKDFNADLVTHFDEKLARLNAIPQDIGRVLLNLFNNAFYAVNQKAKAVATDYKAEVSVSTSTENGRAIIKVKDNGTGMPDAIKEKIMQPFFTTKPTGEGTGLGLSLSYDMVVKRHGGTIQINSTEGEGSEFIISLPIS